MATHRSILASRIPWTEEPGGLQFMRVTKSWTQLKLLSMHASKWATVCSWPAFHPQLSQYLQLKGRGKSVDEQGESLELHHNLRLQDGTGLGKKERCRQSDEYLCSQVLDKRALLSDFERNPRGQVRAEFQWRIPVQFITEGFPGETGGGMSKVGQERGKSHVRM